MVISSALKTALSGLRFDRDALEVVAQNINKANLPGYNRRVITPVEAGAGVSGRTGITRVYSAIMQRRLSSAISDGSRFEAMAAFAARIDQLFGTPGGAGRLDKYISDFTSALRQLASDPSSGTHQSAALAHGQRLTNHLNYLSQQIQELRNEAEIAIGQGVGRLNTLLGRLAKVNHKLRSGGSGTQSANNLQDSRDLLLEQISKLTAIEFRFDSHGAASVQTKTGIMLLEREPVALSFDGRTISNARMTYSNDPTQRQVGTVSLGKQNARPIDLLRYQALQGGKLSALIDLRDNILPRAQSQLDEIAAALATAVSSRQNDPVVSNVGGKKEFTINLSELAQGDSLNLKYTDATGKQNLLRLVKVNNPAHAGQLADASYGIDFSKGIAAAITDINSHLVKLGLTATSSGSGDIRIGARGATTLNAVSAPATVSALSKSNPLLPLFTDGGKIYTEFSGGHSRKAGLAARITINQAVSDDPSLLVRYNDAPPTPAGDSTRPMTLAERIDNYKVGIDPNSGILPGSGGGGEFPGATLGEIVAQTIAYQGNFRKLSDDDFELTKQAVSMVYQNYNDDRGVDIDQEMGKLLQIQQHYSANARVMKAANDMIELLMRM